MDLGWEKVSNLECLFVRRKQGLFLSVYMDDIKMAGENQNMAPMWKKLMKNVDLDEPTSFLYHVYFGCTQRESKPNEDIVNQYREMFESRIFAGLTQQITRVGKTPTPRRSRGPTTWNGMLQNALKEIASWRIKKKTEQFYKA